MSAVRPRYELKVHALHRRAPEIETLVVVGAPTGGGKTSFSRSLIAHRLDLDFDVSMPVHRVDARSMRSFDFSGGCLIVEYATTSLFNRHEQLRALDEIDHLASRAHRVEFVTLLLSRSNLIKRYIRRFGHDKLRRTPRLFRYLRIRRWRQVLGYLLGNDYRQSYRLWGEIEGFIGNRENTRVHRLRYDGDPDTVMAE